jgi:hypothetical protein
MAIAELPKTGADFTADDIHGMGGPGTDHPKAAGARLRAPREAGLIRWVGYAKSKRPSLHGARSVYGEVQGKRRAPTSPHDAPRVGPTERSAGVHRRRSANRQEGKYMTISTDHPPVAAVLRRHDLEADLSQLTSVFST